MRLSRTEDLDEIQRLNMLLVGNRLTDPQLHQSAWWLATGEDGDSAGFCGVKADTEGQWVYLIRAGVCEGYRGRGLQRRMIQVRLNWARRCTRAAIAITDTIPENTASNNNLIRCGFRLYTPDYPWVGEEGVLYWQRAL